LNKNLSEINIGSPLPLGTSITPFGVNFSIVATNADFIEILIFETGDSKSPKNIYTLNENFRSGPYWHAEIKGLKEGDLYAYRVYQKNGGLNNDYSEKVLIDPCSRGIGGWESYQREHAMSEGGNLSTCLKSVVCERNKFNFKDFPRPKHPWRETIIYELHIKAFTENQNSEDIFNQKSCFQKILEKIPYLKELGITSIELLPIFCFDPTDAPNNLENFWGYSPINWFTPHYQYFAESDSNKNRNEFRRFVEECHKFNIEVILDVVYNHTSEGNKNGPALSWKGVDENLYYFINKNQIFQDVSGCGNTIAANRGLVRKIIIESLKCWANELGVDGFRFDLGVALTRGENLVPLDNSPFFEDIEAEPELADIKLISEPWDCGGLYKLKDFPSKTTFTWNGHFRDDVRRFWKGEDNTAWSIKDKVQGSPGIYQENNKFTKTINFVTSHDGFTLKDLVSFNRKHNFANREKNNDGDNHNNSFNYGVEGPTTNEKLNDLRKKQQKNMLFTLLMSRGVPMMLMGDEIGRSKGGNNNTWCQNNALGWMNWSGETQDKEILDFVKSLINVRKNYMNFINPEFLNNSNVSSPLRYQWHGIDIDKPDWSSWSHTLAYSINQGERNPLFWFGFNAYSKSIKFSLPDTPSNWSKIIDTSRSIIFKPQKINEKSIEVEDKSSILIIANELLGSNNQIN